MPRKVDANVVVVVHRTKNTDVDPVSLNYFGISCPKLGTAVLLICFISFGFAHFRTGVTYRSNLPCGKHDKYMLIKMQRGYPHQFL